MDHTTPPPPDRGRRLDAREMDQLAKDAREILGKAARGQGDLQSQPQKSADIGTDPHGVLDPYPPGNYVGVPGSIVGDNVVRTPPPPQWDLDKPRELDDLGRMSAEAVAGQYEAAARAFEEMGTEVKERVAKIGNALIECDKDLKEIAEIAAQIRERGKHVQAQIEEASALSTDIRSSAAEVRRKLGL